MPELAPRELHRRTADAPWPIRLTKWALAPAVDHWTGISLSRLVTMYFAYRVGVTIAPGTAITTNQAMLALGIIAASFGKSTLQFFLQRTQFKATAVDTVTTAIRESRMTDQGFQPTP